MPSQYELIQHFQNASLAELTRLIHRPGPEEAEALRIWLGRPRYEALRQQILTPAKRGGAKEKRRNVVVLHGIMGAELSVRKGADGKVIWVSLPQLLGGQISQLQIRADGSPTTDSFASDMMRKYYLEMLVGLARDHEVEPFWFDWRLDLNQSAARLQEAVTRRFGTGSEVDFVGHSMGGLVVRTWIKNFAARWNKGCRLIMLGTPNHGSFAIAQVITGAHKMVRKLARADFRHNLSDFTKILNTFPGSYQMLPSPRVMETMEPLYRAETWPGRGVSQRLLDAALKHHDALAKVIDRERMIYIAGTGHLTASDFRDWSAMDRLDGYVFTPSGDETVPHKLGFLSDDGGRVPVHYSRANHGALPNDPKVVQAVREYLADGKIQIQTLPDRSDAARGAPRSKDAALLVKAEWDLEIAAFAAEAPVVLGRGLTRKDAAAKVTQESNLLSGFLDESGGKFGSRGFSHLSGSEESSVAAAVLKKRSKPPTRQIHPIEFAVRLEDIATFGKAKDPAPGAAKKGPAEAEEPPEVIFLAAGHYQGVEPQWAEKELDLRLSKALGLVAETETADSVDPDCLYITAATRRGSMTMHLGEPYVLPFPGSSLRIALAGLGLPGTFGRAELLVMIGEFTTALAKLGCKHLGTVLIGSGNDNMDVATVCRTWLETLHTLAVSGLPVIPRITFLAISAIRAREIDGEFSDLIEHNKDVWGGSLIHADLTTSGDDLETEINKEIRDKEHKLKKRLWNTEDAGRTKTKETPATFINVARIADGFEFSAITNSASIPVRTIKVDPVILDNIGRRLAENGDPREQAEWGALMESLLVPRDLRAKLFSSAAPVVITVDATTARIPWEMLRVSSTLPQQDVLCQPAEAADPDLELFLGSATGFGVTRQLRTSFAPAPEIVRGMKNCYRFLIVADPAEDAPLKGAQEEALAVARIAEELGDTLAESGLKVEIVELIGPAEATREDVLRHLTQQRFDALHFAGHCYFDAANPAESGWIFHAGRKEHITAAELSRLDHVPPFVFSNACESGVTPDRFDGSPLALAPAFAEAFFERGVRNLICTAWPVDDTAALVFAQVFYRALLGLDGRNGPVDIREAMVLARRAAANSDYGLGTWGAYQHYGNPFFRFITKVK